MEGCTQDILCEEVLCSIEEKTQSLKLREWQLLIHNY